MRNRNELLEKIGDLKRIESAKSLLRGEDKAKIDLHDQKFNGLEKMESKLNKQPNDNISCEALCEIIADIVKEYPRFAEGFYSKIKKFINEVAPGWDVFVNKKISSSSSPALYSGTIKNERTFKIAMVGDKACGKTSIKKSFLGERFTENQYETVDEEFSEKEIDGVKYQIRDIAGRERKSPMLPIYLKPSSAIIFVFDVSAVDTFNGINSWVAVVSERVSEYASLPKMLVANKIDAKNEQSEALIKNAKKYATEKGMQYAEVTAKDPAAVNAMFNSLIDAVIKKEKTQQNEDYENEILTKLAESEGKRGSCGIM